MPIPTADLDILEAIATALDEDRADVAAACVRDAIAEIRDLRSQVGEAMDLLDRRGVVPDREGSEDCLAARIVMACDLEGAAREERDAALAEIRELRGRAEAAESQLMTGRVVPPWTREEPTEPGDYLMEQRIRTRTAEVVRRLVQVRSNGTELRCWWPGTYAVPIPEDCRWSGPIPEPPEST